MIISLSLYQNKCRLKLDYSINFFLLCTCTQGNKEIICRDSNKNGSDSNDNFCNISPPGLFSKEHTQETGVNSLNTYAYVHMHKMLSLHHDHHHIHRLHVCRFRLVAALSVLLLLHYSEEKKILVIWYRHAMRQ